MGTVRMAKGGMRADVFDGGESVAEAMRQGWTPVKEQKSGGAEPPDAPAAEKPAKGAAKGGEK